MMMYQGEESIGAECHLFWMRDLLFLWVETINCLEMYFFFVASLLLLNVLGAFVFSTERGARSTPIALEFALHFP